jgi:ribosomal 50S subunit-associated protein YjgA (DUF615 family)
VEVDVRRDDSAIEGLGEAIVDMLEAGVQGIGLERGWRNALEVNKQHVKAASSESGLQVPKLTLF